MERINISKNQFILACSRCGESIARHCDKCPACGNRIYRFTERAHAVMLQANAHARSRQSWIGLRNDMNGSIGARSIEPSHIMLGILTGPSGMAQECLVRLCIDMDALKSHLEATFPLAPTFSEHVHLPLSTTSQALIDAACIHAKRLDHDWVGTEHLLMALCDVLNSLNQFGVDTTKIESVLAGIHANPTTASWWNPDTDPKPN